MKHLTRCFSRRSLLCAGVALALVGLSLCLGTARRGLADRTDQQAAERWSADETRFAQVSLYLPTQNLLSPDTIKAKRVSVDTTLTAASITPAMPDARLWLDAYSAEFDAALTSQRGSANVRATAVGGDYFYFHTPKLLSGCTFSEQDEQDDTVVLDELAAWQLFGSSDVVGKTVMLNGASFVVCGVTALPQDSAALLTYGSLPRIWVAYSRVYKSEDANITAYEAVMPDPYDGYALNLLKETFDDTGVFLENTGRYTVGELWKTLRSLPRAALRTDTAVYPWWENAALYNQNRAALLFGAQLLCLLFPAAMLAALAVWGWKHRPWHFKDLTAALEKRRERRLTEAWLASQAELNNKPEEIELEQPRYDTSDRADTYTETVNAQAALPEENKQEEL